MPSSSRCVELRQNLWRDFYYYAKPHYGFTLEALLDIRKRRFYDSEVWKKIRQSDRDILHDRYTQFLADLEQQLCCTYVWDGVRYLAGYGPEKTVSARLIYEYGKEQEAAGLPSGCFCYAFALPEGESFRLLFLPYREADRDGEIQAGRLRVADIGNMSKIFMPKQNLRSGSQVITACQPLTVISGGELFTSPAPTQFL